MNDINVLLVDDHYVVRQGLRALLMAEPGITVVGEADNGRRAVQLTAELRPDVVLMDLAMPVLNGVEATRQIANRVPSTKVLVLTAYSGDDCVQLALEAGAAGYLEKQTAVLELVKAIREVRNGNAYFSESITRRLREMVGLHKPPRRQSTHARGGALTSQEVEILQLLAVGRNNRQIAKELGIAVKSVEKCRQRLSEQLGIRDIPGLIRHALSGGVKQGSRVETPTSSREAPVQVELKIDHPFDSYSAAEQEKLLINLRRLLGTRELRISDLNRGSVLLTLELTPEQAERLLCITKAGDLAEFGVVRAVLRQKGRKHTPLANAPVGQSNGDNASSKKGKKRAPIPPTGPVFIGHGRCHVWKDLRDFLQNRLGLRWDEYNREPTAGISTQERLSEMLQQACFAFLLMTSEDEHADATKHARENVIHEIGLFQAKLGPRRAIVLLEDGCREFSNIRGLSQIRFPRGNVLAVSEEIRRVLERERVLH